MKKQKSTLDWDDAFANMAHVPGSDALPGQWAARAEAYRAGGTSVQGDIPYGNQPREKFDVVMPESTVKGVLFFIHGGYWMRLDKSFWTHYAEGARSAGWAVCIPSYSLAPEARIHEITQQIAQAIGTAAGQFSGPIRLCGHSAGGHLVSRMICDDTPLSTSLLERIEHTVSISGLYDLRPLLWTQMNQTLNLDEQEALGESPVLHRPLPSARVTTWVGDSERPEFIRQAKLLPLMWQGLEAKTRCVIEAEHNHFTILESLTKFDSELCSAILE